MCDPVTIGLTMGAIGGFKKGQAEAAAHEGQAEIADYNAKVSKLQAKDALAIGAVEEQRHRLAVRQLIGSQRASLAGAGVVLSEGSALQLQEDTAKLGELDALQIRNNAATKAWGFKAQVKGYKLQEALAKSAAKGASQGSFLGGAGSLLQLGG